MQSVIAMASVLVFMKGRGGFSASSGCLMSKAPWQVKVKE